MTKKATLQELAKILWQFHNARLDDPSITEMRPYIQPILALIHKEVVAGRVDELDKITRETKADGTEWLQNYLADRIAELNQEERNSDG